MLGFLKIGGVFAVINSSSLHIVTVNWSLCIGYAKTFKICVDAAVSVRTEL